MIKNITLECQEGAQRKKMAKSFFNFESARGAKYREYGIKESFNSRLQLFPVATYLARDKTFKSLKKVYVSNRKNEL